MPYTCFFGDRFMAERSPPASSAFKSMLLLFVVLLVLGMVYKRTGEELRWLEVLRQEGQLALPDMLVGSVIVDWLSRNSRTVQQVFAFLLVGGTLAWSVRRWGGKSIWYALLVLALYAAAQSFFRDFLAPLSDWLIKMVGLLPSGLFGSGFDWRIDWSRRLLTAPWSAAIMTFQLLTGLALIDPRFRSKTPWWVLFGLLALLFSLSFERLFTRVDILAAQSDLPEFLRLGRFGVDIGLTYALQGLAIAYAYRCGLAGAPDLVGGNRAALYARWFAVAAEIYFALMALALIGSAGYVLWRMFGGGGLSPSPVA